MKRRLEEEKRDLVGEERIGRISACASLRNPGCRNRFDHNKSRGLDAPEATKRRSGALARHHCYDWLSLFPDHVNPNDIGYLYAERTFFFSLEFCG